MLREKMKKLSIREIFLIIILGILFPVYPAVSIMEIRHGEVSVIKLLLLILLNSLLLTLFIKKTLALKISNSVGDIKDYLDSRYSTEEQKIIIKNYRRYKSTFFQNLPLFTTAAQIADPKLRQYRNESFKLIGAVLLYTFFYLILLLFLFFIFVWA